MKKYTSILAMILALLMVFTACGSSEEKSTTDSTGSGETTSTASGDDSAAAFNYDNYIDESGKWKDITATDYVEMGEYMGITLTGTTPTEDDIMNEIDAILADYATESYNLERAVEDGDEVNIDYVGSIDGVEFDGGNTQGNGAIVTAGSTAYIDDFLTQIIGHVPGETFNVEVTFPEDYGNADLNGKDAVFVTTINYIIESMPITYTDEAIAANLYEDYGVSTTAELHDYVADYMTDDNIYDAIEDHIFANFSCSEIPELLDEYQKESMKSFYQQYADYYGLTLDEFLWNYMGAENMEELYDSYVTDMTNSSSYFLYMQSIVENEGIVVKDSEVTEFLSEQVGAEMIDSYMEYYGINYLKMLVAQNRVFDLIRENAVIE